MFGVENLFLVNWAGNEEIPYIKVLIGKLSCRGLLKIRAVMGFGAGKVSQYWIFPGPKF